jgi:thymidylate kinase
MNKISIQNKRLLISFSGIDGAGKSTQISRLLDALQLAGLRVGLVTFWDDVARLKSLREGLSHKVFKGDKGVGSPEAPIRRQDKNVQSPLVTLFRMAIYFLDALSLCRTVKKALHEKPGTGADVIIFDRFMYDELANLNLGHVLTHFYVWATLRFVPRPDVAFLLDADPDAAFARKPEYPLEFLHSNRKAYLDLGKMAGMIVIPPSPIDAAHVEVLRRVQQKHYAPHPGVPGAGHVVDQKEFAS